MDVTTEEMNSWDEYDSGLSSTMSYRDDLSGGWKNPSDPPIPQ